MSPVRASGLHRVWRRSPARVHSGSSRILAWFPPRVSGNAGQRSGNSYGSFPGAGHTWEGLAGRSCPAAVYAHPPSAWRRRAQPRGCSRALAGYTRAACPVRHIPVTRATASSRRASFPRRTRTLDGDPHGARRPVPPPAHSGMAPLCGPRSCADPRRRAGRRSDPRPHESGRPAARVWQPRRPGLSPGFLLECDRTVPPGRMQYPWPPFDQDPSRLNERSGSRRGRTGLPRRSRLPIRRTGGGPVRFRLGWPPVPACSPPPSPHVTELMQVRHSRPRPPLGWDHC